MYLYNIILREHVKAKQWEIVLIIIAVISESDSEVYFKIITRVVNVSLREQKYCSARRCF